MTLDNPEKISAQELERTEESKLWESLVAGDSNANMESVFRETLQKLCFEPDLYYLETTETGATVKKKTDSSVIYFTESPVEIETLLKARDLGK